MTYSNGSPTPVSADTKTKPKAKDKVTLRGDWARVHGIVDKVKSVACWGAGLGWLVPWTSSLIVMQNLVDPNTLLPIYKVFTKGQMALTGCKIEYIVHPDVRSDTQYMFTQNHINHFDFVAMHNATEHFIQGVELETHFKYPFYGWFMKTRGTIGVPADKARRYSTVVSRMRSELAKDRSILAFPEGTRTKDGKIGTFRSGMFRMARDLQIEVVPTTVTGMYCFMRKGSLMLRPGKKVTIYCDKPVSFAGLTDEELVQRVKEVRNTMASRVDAYFEAEYGENS